MATKGMQAHLTFHAPQLGSGYLRQCPVFGTGRLATAVAKIPFETASEAERLLAVCRECGLTGVGTYQMLRPAMMVLCFPGSYAFKLTI